MSATVQLFGDLVSVEQRDQRPVQLSVLRHPPEAVLWVVSSAGTLVILMLPGVFLCVHLPLVVQGLLVPWCVDLHGCIWGSNQEAETT